LQDQQRGWSSGMQVRGEQTRSSVYQAEGQCTAFDFSINKHPYSVSRV
jgi:hypothetical protein